MDISPENKETDKMILVTGGTGMLGAHLLLDLMRTNGKVRALKRTTSNLSHVRNIFSFYEPDWELLFDRIEWVDVDLLDYSSVSRAMKGVDMVFHCAATVSFHKRDRQLLLDNNICSTTNMVNAALNEGVRRFCHVSSTAAIGRSENGEPSTEKHVWAPEKKHSGYSESKFYSEMEVWRGIEEGLDAVIVNPSVILGSGNWNWGSPLYFSTIWNGLKYYTRGGTGYVDARDVSRAMIHLTDDENWEKVRKQRFIVSAENRPHRDVFNLIADNLGKKRPSVFASGLMLNIGWRMAALAAFFNKKRPVITRETASGANLFSNYSGKKSHSLLISNTPPLIRQSGKLQHFF